MLTLPMGLRRTSSERRRRGETRERGAIQSCHAQIGVHVHIQFGNCWERDHAVQRGSGAARRIRADSPPIADQKGATKRRLALLLAASICIKQRVMKIGLDQFDLHACIQTGPFT
jgi:hypothetical protein